MYLPPYFFPPRHIIFSKNIVLCQVCHNTIFFEKIMCCDMGTQLPSPKGESPSPNIRSIFSELLSPVRLYVVCNVRAPYSGGCNFRQYFYGIWYRGHPLTSRKNLTEIVPGEPLRWGVKHNRGSQI